MSFTYRLKTFETPQKGKKKNDAISVGVVTPSTFKRKRKLTAAADEEVDFEYRTKFAKVEESNLSSPPPAVFDASAHTPKGSNARSPSNRRSSFRLAFEDEDEAPSVSTPTDHTTTPKRTPGRKRVQINETPMASSTTNATTSTPGKKILKSNTNKTNTTAYKTIQIPPIPDDSDLVHSLSQFISLQFGTVIENFKGKDSFIADHLKKMTDKFTSSLRDQASSNSGLGNLRSVSELHNQLQAVSSLVDRFRTEEEEWIQLKEEHEHLQPIEPSSELTNISSTSQKKSPKKSPKKTTSETTESEDPTHDAMVDISLQVDKLKPILKSVEAFVDISEQFTSRKILEVDKSTTKIYQGKNSPKRLIRDFTESP